MKIKNFVLPKGFIAEDAQYLKRKHTGGISNAKGNVYEDLYLLKQILLRIGRDSDAIFYTQVENRAVDDLAIIEERGDIIYHQLKDTKGLKWNSSGKSRTLLDDFIMQEQMSKELEENFKLKIVTSDKQCEVLKSEIPKPLCHTDKEFFPSKTLTEHLLSNDFFLHNLQMLREYKMTSDMQSILCEMIASHFTMATTNRFSSKNVLDYLKNCLSVFAAFTISNPEIYDEITGYDLKEYGLEGIDCSTVYQNMIVNYKFPNDATLELKCYMTEDVAEPLRSKSISQESKQHLSKK